MADGTMRCVERNGFLYVVVGELDEHPLVYRSMQRAAQGVLFKGEGGPPAQMRFLGIGDVVLATPDEAIAVTAQWREEHPEQP